MKLKNQELYGFIVGKAAKLRLDVSPQKAIAEFEKEGITKVEGNKQAITRLLMQRFPQEKFSCPRCKSFMEKVQLMEGKMARYCRKDRVTVPVIEG